MALFAGSAREIITPAAGGYLFGYNDKTVSNSINDDLNVTALFLQDGDTKLLILSATVCLIHNDLVKEICKKLGKACGISPGNIILSPTHTHSGPRTTGFSRFGSFGSIDMDYCNNIFIPSCVKAAEEAAGKLSEVRVGIGTTESKVGINRRQVLRDDSVTLGQNPWGPYDSTMTVISFLSAADNKPLANIVHIGAHCTAAGNNHEISRDWAGVMTDRLEAESGALSLFLNGASGDIAPRMANGDSVGDIKHAMEVGGLAGIDAVRAFKSVRAYYDEPLKLIHGEISIPYLPPIPLEEIPERLAKLGQGGEDNFERSSLTFLKEMYEKGDTGPDKWSHSQIIARLGPVVFVPYPFEVSSEIALRLRTYSPYGHTLLLGCANGSNSYLPARNQLGGGGYEIKSFLWFRPRQFPEDADRHTIEENLRLIEALDS